jgi:hypothetical protein
VKHLSPTLLLAIALLSCREATAPLTTADFAGSYALRTVNGGNVPQTVASLPGGCSTGFEYGSLVLGDGAFSLYIYGSTGCPGVNGVAGVPGLFGGALAVRGRALLLRAIDRTSPSGAVMELQVTLSGLDALVTFPPGAMQLAGTTVLAFGPRQQPL